MRKELTVHVEAGEEGLEANLRDGHEEGTIVIGFESMKFVVSEKDLLEALEVLKKFREE